MAIDPLLFKYKGDCCAHCGLTVEEMLRRYGVVNKLFQFNHIDPSKKHPDYDNLIQRKLSAEQLDELDKCVLLCSECHIILHAQNGTATIIFTLNLGDRVVEQRVTGQTIHNLETGSLAFFSDQQVLLSVYAVKRGDAKPELLTALELNDGRLLEFVLETRRNGRLQIWQRDRTIMFEAIKLSERRCQIDVHARFPLLKFVDTHEDGRFRLSVRNGQIIYDPKDAPGPNPAPATGMNGGETTYAIIRDGLKELRSRQKRDAAFVPQR